MHALLARYTQCIPQRCRTGFKILRVIAKLEITVWHCPGKRKIVRTVPLGLLASLANKCWGGAYGVFLWRELIVKEHSKL